MFSRFHADRQLSYVKMEYRLPCIM